MIWNNKEPWVSVEGALWDVKAGVTTPYEALFRIKQYLDAEPVSSEGEPTPPVHAKDNFDRGLRKSISGPSEAPKAGEPVTEEELDKSLQLLKTPATDEPPYHQVDHDHCWEETNPPCGQKIEHLKCCLCELLNPKCNKKPAPEGKCKCLNAPTYHERNDCPSTPARKCGHSINANHCHLCSLMAELLDRHLNADDRTI
jgi:hypothetical protein